MRIKLWIKEATQHKGVLHAHLGIPTGAKIPKATLKAAAKQNGKIGREARLALRLGKMHNPNKS